MNHDLMTGSNRLAKGGLLRRETRPDERIECLSGVLWVTQDGDPRDVILEAGDGFDFDRRGASVVSALADSRFLLLTHVRQEAPPRVTAPAPSRRREPAAT